MPVKEENVIYTQKPATPNPTMSRFSYVPLVIFLFAIIFLVLWAAMGKSEKRKKLKTTFGWLCVITLDAWIILFFSYFSH